MSATTPKSTVPPEELLHLIIRFTASIADLPLSISSPRTTATLNLKQLIRDHLPPNLRSNRLRLIYAGKVLGDTVPLHISLNLGNGSGSTRRDVVEPPPRANGEGKSDRKGKTPIRGDGGPGPPPPRLYIHCSIGDALPPAELASEAKSAESARHKLLQSLQRKSSTSASTGSTAKAGITDTSQAGAAATPAPRGFDRLGATGFTHDDIQSLRRSFLAQLSMDHTPETMPTGTALLALEDRWLDATVDADTLTDSAAFGGGGGLGLGEDDEAEQLDNMFWGNIFGFFCPVLAFVWGFREEGLWTRRRQIAVLTGIIINLVFGFARLSS